METSIAIRDNIDIIKERIAAAAIRSGRKAEDISLMAVSKFQPVSSVQAAYERGIRIFGESRVQESLEKFTQELRDSCPNIELGMVGSLQRNKINKAISHFDSIQSVDSLELLMGILERIGSRKKPLELCLELHTGEASKTGFPDTSAILYAIEQFLDRTSQAESKGKEGLCVLKGLMTLAPYTDDKPTQILAFKRMRTTMETVLRQFDLPGFDTLSMGMSEDFETAIEEGSTLVRIGTAIFGQRA
jgi:pyridoxal phosphate enzyme (YggS family)